MISGPQLKRQGKQVQVRVLFIRKQGDKAYIITNHHVVEGAQELEITFDDGTKTEGTLVGSDMWTDLAVIEIDAANCQNGH